MQTTMGQLIHAYSQLIMSQARTVPPIGYFVERSHINKNCYNTVHAIHIGCSTIIIYITDRKQSMSIFVVKNQAANQLETCTLVAKVAASISKHQRYPIIWYRQTQPFLMNNSLQSKICGQRTKQQGACAYARKIGARLSIPQMEKKNKLQKQSALHDVFP